MTSKDFLEKLDYNAIDPEDVIRAITEALNSNLKTSEEKLFVIGKILDANKEHYINELKRKISKHHANEQILEKEIAHLRKEVNKLAFNQGLPLSPKKPRTVEEPKKKVIVVKKKVNNG